MLGIYPPIDLTLPVYIGMVGTMNGVEVRNVIVAVRMGQTIEQGSGIHKTMGKFQGLFGK